VKVKDVMHGGAIWVSPNASISEVARKMRDNDVGAIPVGDNDRLVGMVTDRDITCRGLPDARDLAWLTASNVMSRPVFCCRAEDDVKVAIHIMEMKKVRRLPVINEKKRMVGMLSLDDIAQKAPEVLSAGVFQAVAGHHLIREEHDAS